MVSRPARIGRASSPVATGATRTGDEENRDLARFFGMDIESEWALIRQCQRGRYAAFEPLVLKYQGEALAVAEALLDPDDAADAVQDAFVRAFRNVRSLTSGSGFGPWFRTILRNRCLDRLRSVAHRGRETITEDRVAAHAWIDPVGTEHLERDQLASVVHRALHTLSAAHREVLVLKEMDGLGYAEIASALRIPEGTVASRVYHARAALRRALSDLGVTAKEAEGSR
jgi:RNA polymerase sigma-70 factor (ECF subfamily)